MRNCVPFDSFDNYNKSRTSGVSSAVKSSEPSKDGKSSYQIFDLQPKSQRKKSCLSQSLKMSKLHYFSHETTQQKAQRRKFAERQSTFFSQSKKDITWKNSQAHDQTSYSRIHRNHRRTEERKSFLIRRGRSKEKITYQNPSARTNRVSKSLDKDADLFSWNLVPEYFEGMDFNTYIPVRNLGAGAHGSAYEVLHKNSGQNIVTKLFRKKKRGFFRHEAAVLAQLKKISEILTNNTFEFDIEPYFEIEHYYCLNLVAGMGTLDDFIDFLCKEKKTLNEQELLWIFKKLFESYLNLVKLNYAHRDIKPRNIILDPKDLTPKFIDYSLAECYGGMNQITGKAGTIGYISPFLEEPPFTKWDLISADLYSLGITMLEVALPTIDIFMCNNTANIKSIKRMPILKKVLRTLLSNSKKKLTILRKIDVQQGFFKDEDLEILLREAGSDNEEAIDNLNFKPLRNQDSSLAEKYLQDFIKFLKPHHKEGEKDPKKTAGAPDKKNKLSLQEQEESEHPLSVARRAVKLFNADPESKKVKEAEEIMTCILKLHQNKIEEREYQLILLNNLEFLCEKYEMSNKDNQFSQKQALLDHSGAIEGWVFTRNKRQRIAAEASELPYKGELITKHPQKLTTDNLDLMIFENYCLNEFEKMLKTLNDKQIFVKKFKDFVSNNHEFSELLLSKMVSLQGNLHLLITFLDFIDVFLDASSPEIQKYVDEANMIKEKSPTLYDKFIQNDLNIAMKEITNSQLFYIMIGAILYYQDQIPKPEKFQYDVEQKIQALSKDLNKEIFLSFQPPIEPHYQFPKIRNLVDLCWEGEDTREIIYSYVYKYKPESSKPDLMGLHLNKRANFRLKALRAWIDQELGKLQNIPDIYMDLETYIESDLSTIEAIKKSLANLKNMKRFRLHLVQPFKAEDKARNKILKQQYDEFLDQTLDILSCLGSLLQLEIIFDFIYISPIGLQLLGKRVCELKELKVIEIEFSYCPHITDESVKKVIVDICSTLELKLLVFKLFACQKVNEMDSIKNVLDIPEMENISKTEKIDFVCQPYSEHHSRAEVAGVVSQGFPLFL